MSRPHAWWCSGGPLCLCGAEVALSPGAIESLRAWRVTAADVMRFGWTDPEGGW